MPSFSKSSLEKLNECHPDLQKICHSLIKEIDFTILEGYRGCAKQNKLFKEGKTKLKFPRSKHNKKPAKAIDIVPYPVDWEETIRFYYLAGCLMGTAMKLREEGTIIHRIRWGGDWDGDENFKDQSFNDLVHFELMQKKAHEK